MDTENKPSAWNQFMRSNIGKFVKGALMALIGVILLVAVGYCLMFVAGIIFPSLKEEGRVAVASFLTIIMCMGGWWVVME